MTTINFDFDTLEPTEFIHGPDSGYKARVGDLLYSKSIGLFRESVNMNTPLRDSVFNKWVIALAPVKVFMPTENGWYWSRTGDGCVEPLEIVDGCVAINGISTMRPASRYATQRGLTWLGPVEPYKEDKA